MSMRSRLDDELTDITDRWPELELSWAYAEEENRWHLFYLGSTHLFTNAQLVAWIGGFKYGRTVR